MESEETARLRVELYEERLRNEQLAEQLRSLLVLVSKLNNQLYGEHKNDPQWQELTK